MNELNVEDTEINFLLDKNMLVGTSASLRSIYYKVVR
jgi:hypothetical protein